MPSKALSSLDGRLKEIDLLLQAHEALVKFHRAEKTITSSANTTLKGALQYAQRLVEDVGPGRPPQVQVVSKAAIVLLSAHLQGYIADIHAECAGKLFDGRVKDLAALIAEAPTRGNPNPENITTVFASLGFPGMLDGIRWPKMSNSSVRKRLREMNELRNRIAHGSSETVRKQQVKNGLGFVRRFAEKLDEQLKA